MVECNFLIAENSSCNHKIFLEIEVAGLFSARIVVLPFHFSFCRGPSPHDEWLCLFNPAGEFAEILCPIRFTVTAHFCHLFLQMIYAAAGTSAREPLRAARIDKSVYAGNISCTEVS